MRSRWKGYAHRRHWMYSMHYAAKINLRWLCSVIMSDVFSSAIWQVPLLVHACITCIYYVFSKGTASYFK